MWIMLNDAFFSIVAKDCNRDELMVRARRPGDIEKVFPSAKGRVSEFTASDYHYRCAISKDEIKRVMCGEIDRVTYSNFKNSVSNDHLHHAYERVWAAMSSLQPKAPFSGRKLFTDDRIGGVTPEEYAHVFATGHMPEEDFFSGLDQSAPETPKTKKRPSRAAKSHRGR